MARSTSRKLLHECFLFTYSVTVRVCPMWLCLRIHKHFIPSIHTHAYCYYEGNVSHFLRFNSRHMRVEVKLFLYMDTMSANIYVSPRLHREHLRRSSSIEIYLSVPNSRIRRQTRRVWCHRKSKRMSEIFYLLTDFHFNFSLMKTVKILNKFK